jgi:hypothetical protein
MRRSSDLPLRANFTNKRICLMYISLNTSALLKQVPLILISINLMLCVRTWCVVICVNYLGCHQVATVQCTDSSFIKD